MVSKTFVTVRPDSLFKPVVSNPRLDCKFDTRGRFRGDPKGPLKRVKRERVPTFTAFEILEAGYIERNKYARVAKALRKIRGVGRPPKVIAKRKADADTRDLGRNSRGKVPFRGRDLSGRLLKSSRRA